MFIGSWILTMIFLWLISIASSVFLGLCVYYDARYKNMENPELWGLLTGFLGLIPLIIYLIIRSKQTPVKICMVCGLHNSSALTGCLRCHNQLPPATGYTDIRSKEKSKMFLILTIVSFAVSIIGTVVWVLAFFSSLFYSISSFY